MRAMDAARLRMQENYDRLVEQKAEKLKEVCDCVLWDKLRPEPVLFFGDICRK